MISNPQDCRKLGLYYIGSKKNTIQPMNIVIKTTLSVKNITDDSWIKNDIFKQNHILFLQYIHLLQEKVPPVSSLYFNGVAQNYAYQYKTNSLSKKEHIRFWEFFSKKSNLKVYYASISYNNGYEFSFYNYFFTPIHKIGKIIDKSRNFFYNFLLNRRDLKVKCYYIQTKCKVIKKIGDNEPSEGQKYYTNGKVLECLISKR